MNTIKDLLDAVKTTAGIQTDYALAKELGVHRQLVSSFYKGTRRPDNSMCLEIAERLRMPLERVIAIVEIEAEKDEKRREVWKGYYKSIGGYAASFVLVFFLAVTLIVTPTPAQASVSKVSDRDALYYVKLQCCWHAMKKAVLTVLRTLATAFPRFGFSG